MPDRSPQRLYYSISDVCSMADLKPHVLRYWESEFPELRPKKNRAGNRAYRDKDIKLVFLIKQLLYDEKYTIEGAKQKLKKMKRDEPEKVDLAYKYEELKVTLRDLKRDLKELLQQFDG
ncbi:MerR family transcriptional regulator [candidate division KSB1 bacterium]